jgi:hypothetical protein
MTRRIGLCWCVAGALASCAPLADPPVGGVDSIPWTSLAVEFESGVPSAAAFAPACRTGARRLLPDLRVLGCAACVGAVWCVAGRPVEPGAVVACGDPVRLEIRYSGERHVGEFRYAVEFSSGGVVHVVPLDVRVLGPWRPERPDSPVVAGRSSPAWFDVPGRGWPVVRGDGTQSADWIACTEATGPGDGVEPTRRVSLTRADGWRDLNHALLESGSASSPDAGVAVQMIGLPAFDVATTPSPDGAEARLLVRSRLSQPAVLRIAAERGNVVTEQGVYLAGGASVETPLRKPPTGDLAVVRVESPSVGYLRLVPIR